MVLFVRVTGLESSKRKIRSLSLERKEKARHLIDVALIKHAKELVKYIRKRMQDSKEPGIRSKQLIRSIEAFSGRFRGVPSIKVGVFKLPAARYATTIEEGTQGFNPASSVDTIRPKEGGDAKYLAVPNENDSRVVTGLKVKKYKSPLNYPDPLKFIPFTRSGIAVGGLFDAEELRLARKNNISLRSIAPLYFLLTQVDIKPRPYLRPGADEYIPKIDADIVKIVLDFLSDVKDD